MIDKIKDKYDIILGFVTLVISFSAFKDELSKVIVDLGYYTINLSQYLLFIVCGFGLCLYLYIVENIARDSRIGQWKLFDYLLQIAYYLFAFILVTPLIITINVIIAFIYTKIFQNENSKLAFFHDLNYILAVLSTIVSFYSAFKFRRKERLKKIDEILEIETKEIDNANKLYKDGYYSHVILECFKIIETYLYKKLSQIDIRAPRNNTKLLLELSLKKEIIDNREIDMIYKIRNLRNIVAHTTEEQSMEDAKESLDFVKGLIERNP